MGFVDVEHCEVSVSGLAMRIGGTMWWLFHPKSKQLSFPSRSDGHAQV